MTRAALFEAPKRARKRPMSRALVPLSTVTCPDCGGHLARIVADQRALFYFGGYGGTRRTVTLWCTSCRWGRVAEQTTGEPAQSLSRHLIPRADLASVVEPIGDSTRGA